MRKKIILVSFIFMVAMILMYAVEKKNEKKIPEKGRILEAFACIASAPPSATVGQVVQFQSNAAADNAGTVAGTDNIVGIMRYVPASIPGYFYIGSPASDQEEPGRAIDEPLKQCQLTRNLAVMQHEVTRQMWTDLKSVQSTLPSDPTSTSYGGGVNNPVQNVRWYEAILFANLLSNQNGFTLCYYTDSSKVQPITAVNYGEGSYFCDFTATGYRLPTELEWEYFCRAGTTTPFSVVENKYGADTFYLCTPGVLPVLETVAVFCANAPGGTAQVGSKLPNPWNLKDVHGNVSEWCWDWYAGYPTGSLYDYNGPNTGTSRVIRGGDWRLNARFCRSASRLNSPPSTRNYYIGFRLVRSL
ncbi:MAG: formylglycine-generating enzyme family protein [Acidobacteria bacterium]|jgi:formylglycine-generating enzyme required for sulfatase activity|nr:formylglycine-generating enzyme family protein [Acidobacteriota bacterium]